MILWSMSFIVNKYLMKKRQFITIIIATVVLILWVYWIYQFSSIQKDKMKFDKDKYDTEQLMYCRDKAKEYITEEEEEDRELDWFTDYSIEDTKWTGKTCISLLSFYRTYRNGMSEEALELVDVLWDNLITVCSTDVDNLEGLSLFYDCKQRLQEEYDNM